jgi:hypothetical protein
MMALNKFMEDVVKFETAFNIGDKGWVMWSDCKHPQQLTIGKIIIEHTDSKGDGRTSGLIGDNYKPQKSHFERYMCEETGIDSGSVYTLGQHIFTTEEECREVNAEQIKKLEEQERQQKEYQKQEKLRREATLRAQLAEIERIKAEGV